MPAPSRAAIIKLGALCGLFAFFVAIFMMIRGPHLSVTAVLLLALLLTGLVAAGFWVLLRFVRREQVATSGSDRGGK